MNTHNKISISGTGVALPDKEITSSYIDLQQGYRKNYTEDKTGVATRFYASTESASDLAIMAINNALKVSKLTLDDIDCIISGSGTMEQSIPCNAARVHARLHPPRPIPAFDINMTCLSTLMAMDIAVPMLLSKKHKHILIFSSDIASVGVDWEDIKTGGLFGDGAAAIILSSADHSQSNNCPRVLTSKFETYSEGVDYCEIKGGGSLHHPSKVNGDYRPFGKFQMKGPEIYKLAAKNLEDFIKRTLDDVGLKLDDIDWVVPHQASQLALVHLQKRLKLPQNKVINIIKNHGNQVATSIPTAFHTLLQKKELKKGDKILFVGTSAGVSLGAALWEW